MLAGSRIFNRISYSAVVASVGKVHTLRSTPPRTRMSYSEYEVDQISKLPDSPPATIIESLRFPPTEIVDVVTTEISLWEVESNVGGFFSISYWKSLFNRRKDYNVIVHQINPLNTDDKRSFLVHVTDDLDISREAYNDVCATLEPLVDDCRVLLTEDLLENIILPAPKKPGELANHLAEVMESDPDAHPDWVNVMQALVLSAIKCDNDDQVVDKLHAHVDARAADGKGNTALHLAKSSKNVQRVIQKASEKIGEEEKKRLLNQPNHEGKGPLHSAFQENKADVACELIQAGADLENSTQDEDGSNPFHLAAESGSAESVGAAHQKKDNFLQKESSNDSHKRQFVNALNMPNKKGFTPLMLSVQKGHINSSVVFLQAGADPDVKHCDTGDTALHYAVQNGNVHLLKALLAFGADVEIENGEGKVPLAVASASTAEGANECVDVLETIIQAMAEAASQVSDEFQPLPVPDNSIFLLSMDGGGTRGLLLTQTLIAIQKRMKELKPDCHLLHKYFDYVAGTSAGGLVTLSLVCAGATLEATRASLFKAGDEICTLSPTFPDKVVTLSSQQTYGKHALMTDVKKPRVIIPSVLADCNPPVLHLNCNYGEARNGKKPPSQWKVWEVSRATSAAPFYFPPFQNVYVDGGVMANNPTLDAMSEIVAQTEREGSDAKLALVVSIGTGVLPPPAKVEDVGIFVPNLGNFFSALRNIPDTFSAIFNFLHLLISQATVSNGQETIRAGTWCDSLGIPYYRLSAPLDSVIDLAESDKKVLTDMMYQGNIYLLKNAKKVDTIARYLLSRPQP